MKSVTVDSTLLQTSMRNEYLANRNIAKMDACKLDASKLDATFGLPLATSRSTGVRVSFQQVALCHKCHVDPFYGVKAHTML